MYATLKISLSKSRIRWVRETREYRQLCSKRDWTHYTATNYHILHFIFTGQPIDRPSMLQTSCPKHQTTRTFAFSLSLMVNLRHPCMTWVFKMNLGCSLHEVCSINICRFKTLNWMEIFKTFIYHNFFPCHCHFKSL